MKSLLLFSVLCVSLSLTQCHNDDSSSPCTDNPTENLPWLKEKIKSYEDVYPDVSMVQDACVFQGIYKSKIVFSIVVTCVTCYMAPAVYDCQGNLLEIQDTDDVKQKKLIWSLPPEGCE